MRTEITTDDGITIKVGDRIKITSATRAGRVPAWRIVRGFDYAGRPLVKFHGWNDFVVRPHEIADHEPA